MRALPRRPTMLQLDSMRCEGKLVMLPTSTLTAGNTGCWCSKGLLPRAAYCKGRPPPLLPMVTSADQRRASVLQGSSSKAACCKGRSLMLLMVTGDAANADHRCCQGPAPLPPPTFVSALVDHVVATSHLAAAGRAAANARPLLLQDRG
jgi:hypothetical protein